MTRLIWKPLRRIGVAGLGLGLALAGGGCAGQPRVTPEAVASPPPATTAATATVSAARTSTPRQAPAPSALPASPSPRPRPAVAFDPIQLAWFYKPPANGDLRQLDPFDFFILTHKDEAERDALQASHAGQTFIAYFLLNEIYVPATCLEEPYGSQVAYIEGDYCQLRDQHPEWFLRDAQGAPIMIDAESVMMDAGQPGWRAFWLRRAKVAITSWGWGGIFLDNVEASLGKLQDNGHVPQAYADDAQYQAQVEVFLKEIYEGYFQPSHVPLLANIIAVKDAAVWGRYLRYLDGAMLEQFAVDWTDGYLTPEDWEQQLRLVEQAAAQDKRTILVVQGARGDQRREQFALASYLLVTYPQAYFRYTNDRDYDQAWLYANYGLDLGQPTGTRYLTQAGWRRDFERGHVVVDPAAQTAAIVTP